MYSKIKRLFQRYQSGKASPLERKVIEDWFSDFDNQQNQLLDKEHPSTLFAPMDRKMQSVLHPHTSYVWLKAAAIVVISLSAVLYISHINSAKLPEITYQVIKVSNGVKKEISLPDSSNHLFKFRLQRKYTF